MTAHAAIAAVPKTGQPNRTLLQALLVSRVAWVIDDDEDPTAFDPRGQDGSPLTLVLGYRGSWFWFDEGDATTGHDGTTCIVTSATGGRYKVTGVDLLITHVISNTLTTPPDPDDVVEDDRPDDGDSYLIPDASTGDWATKENYIATWVEARCEWFYIAPKPGWFVWVAGAVQDTAYHYDSVQAAWITGLGGGLLASDSAPLSAIIGCAASLTIRVENQTTYAPPGSRKTGATPTMPLGGTASNINDNSDTTTAVTAALGNLTGATVASRIIARLALASATNLICIEARGALGSAASSATAMGLYYSIDNGANWVQAGAGFTLSTSSQNVQRTGTFAGVTDIALVTEGKNWVANTNTLAGLNAYDATVTGAVGDAYVIAANPFGIFAGFETKVAICEVVNTYTIYTPATGDEVFDKAQNLRYQFNGTAWTTAGGAIVAISTPSFTQGTGSTSTSSSSFIAYSNTVAPTSATGFRRNDDVTISYTAKRAGAKLLIKYRALFIVAAFFGPYVGGILRDSEVNAIAWDNIDFTAAFTDVKSFECVVDAPDALAHTYKFSLWIADGSANITSFAHRLFYIEELG